MHGHETIKKANFMGSTSLFFLKIILLPFLTQIATHTQKKKKREATRLRSLKKKNGSFFAVVLFACFSDLFAVNRRASLPVPEALKTVNKYRLYVPSLRV
jgi:branched-subunit amino acid permease